MTPAPAGPVPRSKIIELYFMEHRAKLIDLAAFLDRCDRAADDLHGREDFRLRALREGIAILLDGQPDRAARVLDHFSDQTLEPIASAAGMKGAFGAVPPPMPSPVTRGTE